MDILKQTNKPRAHILIVSIFSGLCCQIQDEVKDVVEGEVDAPGKDGVEAEDEEQRCNNSDSDDTEASHFLPSKKVWTLHHLHHNFHQPLDTDWCEPGELGGPGGQNRCYGLPP